MSRSVLHQLLLPETVVYGSHAFEQLGIWAPTMGSKALVISDPVMQKLGVVHRCEQLLQGVSIPHVTYTGVDSEPTDRHVNEGLRLCREHQCRFIVAVGGGSCIDTAKAVAVMMHNDGFIGDYAGGKRLFAAKPLPLIAIPTTAGTGSEVTKVTVITDSATNEKMMISQPQLLPQVALVDPLLTLSCPPNTTAATGIDALCHAVEAYLSRKAHPITDSLALTAIRDISAHILRAYEHGEDVTAREKMMIGSMMAGAAFSNASVALVHGMSRPIGARFHVPHGISNAMLFPAVLEYTRNDALPRLADIGRVMRSDLAGKSLTEGQWADVVINEIKSLCLSMQIPNLNNWGIERQAFESALSGMADDAIKSGSPANNPKIPDHSEIIGLYKLCYEYDYTVRKGDRANGSHK